MHVQKPVAKGQETSMVALMEALSNLARAEQLCVTHRPLLLSRTCNALSMSDFDVGDTGLAPANTLRIQASSA